MIKRKTGKKLLSMLLVAVCILSLAGCTVSDDTGNTCRTADDGKVTTGNEGSDGITDDEKSNTGSSSEDCTVKKAEYPQMVQYPDESKYAEDYDAYNEAMLAWRSSRNSLAPESEEYKNGLQEFCTATVEEFLGSADNKNKVYSPINVYMALAMLAELTDGESRAQILNLMQVETMEELRTKITDLWNATYCDDGMVKSLLGSSLWMNENVNFVPETMDTLADTYRASSFQGQMGSAEFNKALQSWLNEQTGGLLEEQASGVEMSPETILALATTIYYKARWSDEFFSDQNIEKVFHGTTGDVTCEFMCQTDTQTVFAGEKFTAIEKNFLYSGSMYLILPDEGVQAEELLQDDEIMDLIFSGYEWENRKNMRVNLKMPKFDVVSDMSLNDGLKNLGVTDVFDAAISDFTPMTTDTDQIEVSTVSHAARVKVDEEGCEAAAYTVIMMETTALFRGDEIDFVLDRPFIFVITGADGLPLFVGVVNQM